ncbi:hypothetical protein PTKIN_Ptkin10aG0073500 [Pterospermum kingtungense]
MASKISSLFLARLLLVSILLAIVGQAVANRNTPKDDGQMKQPEFLHKHDRSVLIPGLGRVLLPPVVKHHKPYTGSIGGIGGATGGVGGTGYVPGGDDTFVPNPGFEVPNPGNGVGSPGARRNP